MCGNNSGISVHNIMALSLKTLMKHQTALAGMTDRLVKGLSGINLDFGLLKGLSLSFYPWQCLSQ